MLKAWTSTVLLFYWVLAAAALAFRCCQGRGIVTLVTSASQWRSIAQSLFDCEKLPGGNEFDVPTDLQCLRASAFAIRPWRLERSLGGETKQPFTSKTFLSKKVGLTEKPEHLEHFNSYHPRVYAKAVVGWISSTCKPIV